MGWKFIKMINEWPYLNKKTYLLSELYVLLSRIHIIAICLYYFLFLCLVLIVL